MAGSKKSSQRTRNSKKTDAGALEIRQGYRKLEQFSVLKNEKELFSCAGIVRLSRAACLDFVKHGFNPNPALRTSSHLIHAARLAVKQASISPAARDPVAALTAEVEPRDSASGQSQAPNQRSPVPADAPGPLSRTDGATEEIPAPEQQGLAGPEDRLPSQTLACNAKACSCEANGVTAGSRAAEDAASVKPRTTKQEK